jgi:ribulose-phosphate 3-epimerase
MPLAGRDVQISPSILSADFARLGEQVAEAERAGANRIHFDVMDGHFVPNITIGPVVLESVRRSTKLPIEVHLMVRDPARHLSAFAEAGADWLIVHVEATATLHRTLSEVRQLGKKPGVVLNPATPAEMIREVLPEVDQVLVMTVEPGFGGQKFIRHVVPKIGQIRRLIDERGLPCEIAVDGGVDAATAAELVRAGANVLVAGSSIYRAKTGVAAALRELRAAATA